MRVRPAPRTFGTKSEAEIWLVKTEAEIRDDHWLNPDQGQITFGKYARAWVEEHQGNWNHEDWLALLEELKKSPLWPMQPDAVGLLLEDSKREWLERN